MGAHVGAEKVKEGWREGERAAREGGEGMGGGGAGYMADWLQHAPCHAALAAASQP